MAISLFDNAISWSQLRIKGGWRSLWIIAGGYGVIAIAVIFTAYQLAYDARDRLGVMQGSTYVLEGIQCILLLILAPMLIAASIRSDIQTHQLESHRLMPLTPRQAVIGYIVGSTSRMIALAGVNIVIGSFTATLAGFSLPPLAFAQLVLFIFAAFTWCLLALSSFISRAGAWLLMIIVGVVTMGQAIFLAMVPALLMVCSPLIAHTIFNFSANSGMAVTAMIVAMAGQLALCLIFIGAAARKYASDEALALPIRSALAIFVIWIGFSAYAIHWYSDIRVRQYSEPRETVRQVGTIAAAWITAGLLISSAMWSRLQRHPRKNGDRAEKPSPWPARVCLLFSIAMITLLAMEALKAENETWRLLMALVVTCVFLSQLYVLMKMLYPLFSLANAVVAIVVLFLSLAPLLADLVYFNIFHPTDNPTMDHFTVCSPLGMMICLDDGSAAEKIMPGVAFQFSVLLLFLLMFLITRRKRRVTALAPSPPIAPAISTPSIDG